MLMWTNYPNTTMLNNGCLGDKEPLRQVELLSFDGDKYCWVMDLSTGKLLNLKSGYLYRNRRRVVIKNSTLDRHFLNKWDELVHLYTNDMFDHNS